MGLLRPPGEGKAADGHESEGELGSRPALPAVAGSNSLHFLLTLVPGEAWAAVGSRRVGTTKRTPTVPAAIHVPLLPNWAHTAHSPHWLHLQRSVGNDRTGFLPQVCTHVT